MRSVSLRRSSLTSCKRNAGVVGPGEGSVAVMSAPAPPPVSKASLMRSGWTVESSKHLSTECFTRVKESRQGGGAFEERASDARHLCLSNDRQKTANSSSSTMDPITVAHLGARGAALRFCPEADWKQPFRREAKYAACSIAIPHSQGMRRSSATQRRDQATSSCNQLSVVGWGRARMA